MPLCPNGQKTTIEWQYAGEEKQQILGADGYTVVEKLKGQCFTAYDVTVKAKILQCYQNRIVYDAQSTQRITGQIIGIDLRGYNGYSSLFVEYKAANGSILQSDYFSTSRLIADTACFTNSPFPTSGNRPEHINKLDSTYQIINIVRVDGQLDNCGGCTFSVTKGGIVVYSKIKSVCPTVTYTCGEQCPPGTCQCDCGDQVCCYDTTTGKAVKSFKK